jgi:hypothetical protein
MRVDKRPRQEHRIKPMLKRLSSRVIFNLASQSGASLLIIVIFIMVLAILGAAMYAITSTSLFNQDIAQGSIRAFYVAESGVRVVASEYKSATNKNSALLSLHGKTFVLPNHNGQFTINVYPYWFYATANYILGATSVTLYLPGSVPLRNLNDPNYTPITFPSTGILKLKDTSILTGNRFSTAPVVGTPNANGTPVTFTFSLFPYAIPLGSEFFLGFDFPFSSQTINAGGSLTLNSLSGDTQLFAQIFPPEKGNFRVMKDTTGTEYIYTYEQRTQTPATGAPTSITLTKIACLDPTANCFPLQLSGSGTVPIYLYKTLAIRSRAAY